MPCCGKFLHKRYFKNTNERSFQCGHCRHPNDESDATVRVDDDDSELRSNETLEDSEENQPVWVTPRELRGPTQMELARNAIADMRRSVVAHTLPQEGARSWEALSFPIDPLVWYLFWVNLDWFISTSADGANALYINATVYTTIEPTQALRKTFYQLVNKLIPRNTFYQLVNKLTNW